MDLNIIHGDESGRAAGHGLASARMERIDETGLGQRDPAAI